MDKKQTYSYEIKVKGTSYMHTSKRLKKKALS